MGLRRRIAVLCAVALGGGVLAAVGVAVAIQTLPADQVSAHTAVLHGIGNREGSYFVYWATEGDDLDTTTVSPTSTAPDHSVTVTNLTQDMPYKFEYREAASPTGFLSGGRKSFSTLAGSADVKVSAAASAAQVAPGADATFTATVTNAGPDSAIGIYVIDQLPAGLTLGSVSASQGSCTTVEPLHCTIGALAANASATVTVVASASSGSFSNTFQAAEIESSPGFAQDPSFANNMASASVTFVAASPPPPPPPPASSNVKRSVTLAALHIGKKENGKVGAGD
jgi:uncharacterized repeat protein (TIGR01451 family)